jgi:hypothetical protein
MTGFRWLTWKASGWVNYRKHRFRWLMNSRPVRLNHRNFIFEKISKFAKMLTLDPFFDAQGFLDEAALVRADLRTSTGCVGCSGVSIIVMAKLARVSNPVCSSAGD